MYKKSAHPPHHSSSAFTIVEMVIVIIVIAVLATLTFVSYRGVQHRAEVVGIMSDLKNLSNEMEFFFKDNGRYPLVMPVGGSVEVPELETILKSAKLFNDTRDPERKKLFIFCAPDRYNPQKYAIIGIEKSQNAEDPTATLHYVTSDHAPSSTPLIITDAITAADPPSMYASNACNTVKLKTGTTYFNTYVVRWSFNAPRQV